MIMNINDNEYLMLTVKQDTLKKLAEFNLFYCNMLLFRTTM